MSVDWGYLIIILVTGMAAWLVIACLGALVVGKGIRIADERERANDESPAPLLRGPGSVSSEDG